MRNKGVANFIVCISTAMGVGTVPPVKYFNFADSNYPLKIRIFLPILWMKMKSKSALLFKNIQKYNAQPLIPVISFTN